MGRYIPGNPNMIVQNMIGASGVTAGNWLYNIAPKDGTIMGTFAQTVPLEPLFGNQQARFKWRATRTGAGPAAAPASSRPASRRCGTWQGACRGHSTSRC